MIFDIQLLNENNGLILLGIHESLSNFEFLIVILDIFGNKCKQHNILKNYRIKDKIAISGCDKIICL